MIDRDEAREAARAWLRGGGPRSRIQPQHRMVAGLLAMSAASFVLTVLWAPSPAERAAKAQRAATGERAAAVGPGRAPGARAAVGLGTAAEPVPWSVEALDTRLQAAAAALQACVDADPRGLAPVDGRVELGLRLGAGGLEAAWLDGVAVQPGADLGVCFAAALGGPWPAPPPPGRAATLTLYVVQPPAPAPR